MSVRTETVESDANAPQPFRVRLWRYVPLLLWLSLIFYASTGELSASNTSLIVRPLLRWLFPDIGEEKIAFAHFLIRKGAHFAEYAILGLLAARAFYSSHHFRLRRFWFLASLLLVALCALSDELHQRFVPTRTGTIYDSLIDIAGGISALTLFALWHKHKARMKTGGKGKG